MNFLPGWQGGLGLLKSTVLTSLSFVDHATSTSDVITGPAGIQAGDILALLDRAVGGKSTPTAVVPTGFNNTINSADSSVRQIFSYKIADGSEASASLTGMDGATADLKILAVYRGNVPITTVTPSTPTAEITVGDPSSQSIAASGSRTPLICFGCYGSSGVIDPRTWTGGTPVELNNGTSLYLLREIFTSSPANITIDMADEGSSNCLQGVFLECS